MGRPRTTTNAVMVAICATSTMPIASAAGADRTAGPLLVLTVGRMNMKYPDEGPWNAGVEYRWAPLGRSQLIPSVGITVAEQGAAYAYATLQYDFHLGRSWTLTPMFGAGAFHGGGDLDLGYPLEFKTGLAISCRVAERYRVGVVGYHLSNASLSEDNPGTEVVELLVAIPVGAR